MGTQVLLCLGILAITAVSGCPIGQEFITAFMPNYVPDDANTKPTLSITAQESVATVAVEVKGLNFKQSVKIEKGATKWIILPPSTEIHQDGVSAKTVLITSDADITVVASNIKPYTGDSSVIFPVNQLGRIHVVFTPDGGPMQKIVAIVNGKEANTVDILPYSDLMLNSMKHLQRGVKTTISLAPYEVYLLRSEKTLTGTRIESKLPLAVLSGHECLSIVGTCEHVFEQLVPVKDLSDEYLIPAIHFLIGKDTAHVVAAEDDTDVTVFHGPLPIHKNLRAGELLDIEIKLPTIVRSNKKIMVMFTSSNDPYDEFLTNIIPTSGMSKSWTIHSQEDYENFAVIVSEKQTSLFGLLQLNVFPANTKYTWAIKPIGSQKGPITLSGDSLQAVYVYGGKARHGYSTTGVCNTAPRPPTPPPDPCAAVKCREREQCQKGVCVPTESATCWAVGDPHYKTFDGKRFDFQGTCTYTMSTTTNTELVPFIILAKNNHRGSNKVAYVRTVSVNVYNQTVVASKQRGMVEVNGEITHLPLTLAGGKLQVVQRGWNVFITTDFGLEVKYDWNMMLYITVPSTYFRSLGGLCGNYNGDQKDEFTNPKGTVLSTVLDFAKSWKVSDNDLFCHDDCEGKCLSCPAELQEKYTEEKHCGLMAKANGPFATCHKVVNPDIYVDNCVYDVCINKGIRTFLCDNIRSYVDACMAAGVKIDANWRMLSDCPMQCPENSHYEACATACAASCGDRDAPAKCKQPCVEGCQCNPGFVLSGDKCVPLKECGCTYEGRYYPPADTFWGDKACTKKCSCNSQTGQVTCMTTKCKASQVCDLRNGVRDCYPLSYGQCQGSGDPHYRTFDGKTFDFQGTCTYYLSKLVNTADASLVPYEVLVKNENRGMNKAVSFTKTVEIKIYGYTIILSKDSYGKVMVNGLFVNLPFEKEEGRLSVFRSGYFGTVKTDFGMTVIFNWDSHVSITLPSTYSNMVGGLCGNWNGNQNDDMTMPDKTITTNPTAFGTSWKARNDSGCTEECQGKKCPKCDDAERKKDIFTKGCSLITDKNGPFKGCHARVNPTQFYEDCVYDMCMYGGHITALCNSLSAYTAACQTALTVVEKWRSDTFCPAACKANSHYDVCAAGCPPTCSGLAEPTACQGAPCVEGCVCDNGFVLSNGECVAMEQCGCTYEGQYYHLGQIFYPKDQCNHRCICGDQGRVKCNESFSCGPNERCEIRGGVRACQPEGKGSCSVSGSGTYQSYDGNQINVPGNCVYRMVEIIQTGDQKQIPFSVSVQQLSSLGAAVITRKIDIVVAVYKITLIPGLLWEIRVDQVKAVLPLTLEDGLVKVYKSGFFIILETSFGLKVTYDTVAMAIVEIPSTYKKAVRGLCGDYNDKKEDDFLLPNGKQALSAVEFVQGWMLVQEEVTCQTGCGSRCPQPDKDSQTKAENACKILILDKGPFANCHSKVSPTTFYDACVKDAASHPEDKTLVCHHIQTYVAHCQQASVSINIWRNATFCSMTCPTNSHYELCADTCSSTCASLTVSHTCPVCLEGCQCDEGYVFDGGECKPVDNCGCLVDGRYYKSGETSVLGDCVEVCTCKAGQFSCEPMQCKEDQVCRNKDGVPSCVYVPRLSTPPPDPCAAVKCREREQCQKGVCVPTESATCWAVGDPHYKTFDGKRFDFQGTCTYTMSTTTNTELVPFIILAKNNHRGSNKVAYVRTVSVNVYNQTVVASKQRGMVEVNGEITHLPLTLAGGKLQVVQRGWNVFITTDFGLEVKYDWNMMLYITVPSTYFRSLGGLCGNYNGDQKDEFTNPKGTVLSTVLDFAKSWKVSDNDLFCHDDCEGNCPNCPAELQEKYSEEKHCGLMSKANGPFATCHKVVNPDIYVDNCVYDVCINKGIRTFLCDNIRSYVDACMAAGVKIDANWRMLSDCPLQCPENSHYEACATACAASCGDRDAPAKCKQPCVEGCQCNPGFVLSGDKCVPLKECGCTYEGRYYPPADTFWGDKACTKKCSCNSQTGQVTCTTTKCTASQVCDLRNGVRDCYPLSYGQCQGSGDPHYRTFDGKTFDFQGTCTYYLSKLVNTADASLVPYEVLVKNENRGMNKAVSFTKTVEIKIYGYTIILSKDSYGKVMVNGLFVNLPFEKEEGRLSVFRSGYFGTVKTDFGMTVIFNWDSHVSITLPSTYSNMVGGLCGNWNGNQNDDMTMPDKTITTNPTAFGTSWKARNDSGCTEECQGKKCPKCDDAERKKDIFTKGCSLITDKNGPFKGCHARVNPTQFYEDCVYDMCMYGGHITALCNSLSAYTAACQTALTVVEKWRSDTFCPAACKANSHYDVCAAGCPQTCNGLAEPTACQGAPCVEGCVCDNGFVLSNGECVAMEQCGCTYEGQYYHLGQIFYPKDQCNHRCICGDQGRVKCNESFSCGPNERCEIRGGVRACHPEGKGSCSVSGSGTYQSYDGNQINVPGNCVYRMVEIIQTGDQKQIPFSVSVQQLSSLGAAVITRKIDIIVAAYKITLIPGLLWEIRVDQVKAVLPLTLEDGLVKVYKSGFFIILETSFGLKVTYDTVAMAIVEIPSTYKKAVRGLCGDYNDKKEDDFFLPNGKQALSAVEFVQGWMLVQEEVTCQTGCGSRCPQPDKDSQTKAENACKILILDKGPFANCHSKVSPTTFYDACVKDAASHPEDKTLVCHHIQTYVAHCQQASVSINIWRNATFCSMTCPTNSHYELCADTCSSTCASLTVSHTCPVCLEGCQCDEGYVFDGGECKPVDNCGCLVDGRYYKSGETSVLGDCVEVCTCKAGQFSCEPMQCKEDQVCRNKDGVPSCVYVPRLSTPPPDPCAAVKCREKEQCQKGVCVPTESATCWAVGDPHYKTFDGKRFDFQGTCTYTMSTTTNTELVPFIILAKNNHRGSNKVAYVRTVSVNVYNQTVVASKQRGMVEVNGEITHLPLTLAGGKLQVVQRGWNVFITTDFGLEVKYDWNMMLYITVPSTYFRSLGGLCGNYNGDQKDEFTNPKGTVLSTVLDFAKSWKVSDNDLFCHDDCEGKCPNCPAELQEKYSEEKHCGLMSKANGPFATCHKVVNPDIYVDNCVYDVCINKGIRTFLCDNIRSYVDACMAAGVKIDANWRMLSDCPMQCPENSHYEACATACAASCGDRDAPAKCKQPCVEGCQCNPGFVLSGDKCVPLKECGCTYEGRYYPPADTFWGDKACTKKCSCNSQTGQVTCTTTKCTASQVCDLRNGVRDCYPLSYGQCQGSGDPHYRTFDGKTFDFQGTCTYYLSKLVNTADASLVPYEVLVKNENRGMNKAVSFTKTVEIKIYGYTIILSKDSYGKVMVNGLFVNLPFEKEEGRLSVFRSGYFGTVKTDFGMTVIFNWDSHVSITLPSTYSNMVGGLCGNWNGNQNDDMTMPDKTITTNPTAFGTSWKARNDSGCTEECQGKKCPKCDDAERKKDIFTKGCSLITDKNGPFKGCHARVNPTQFYEDCVYDMCMYGGHITALCNSLSAYTAACQTALTVVEKWRSDTFCPAACKANSHYDVCAAGCPPTCNGLAEPTACQGAPCVEGCVCDNGFVLSNGECVAMEQCGCTYEGQYYHLGQIFYPKDQCNHRCICGDQGRVKCNESFSCGPNERCEIRGGVRACHPEGKGSCSVSGSGTYQSYDGNQINVPGNCVYRMVEIIQTGDQKQIPFSVSVQQLSSLGAAVITRKIDIIVAAYKITLIPGLLWEIRVDQVKAVLPLTLEDGLVKVYQSGFFIILETSFGLKVTYDTVAMAIVEIPSTYKKAVRGLCGDYNDKKEDDFFLPNGKQALSAVEFVQGWMLVQEEVTCQTGCGSRCPQPDKDSQTKAENACKILILDKGPFANCHSKVSPTTFYDACVKDAASHPEDKTLVCHHIQTYVAHCQQASVSINIWRNATFCSMTCPTNSHYELCADTCSSTCASLTVSHTCPVCLEGCQCDEGYVFDGGECKPVDNCGCLVDGRYYKSGETSVLGDCVEVCTCKAGQFSCEPMQCKEDQVCRNKDGVPSCVYVPRLSTPPPDPCAAVKCREREQCQKGVCVPTESATCWAVGDPHYKTFDGKRFDFQGTCTYTMSTTTNTELVPFIILAKNNHRGSNKVAYVRTVSVNVYNQTVVASKQRGMVEVNGEITHLPLTLAGGKLQVVQRGWNVFITTDFGLEVKYDWNMMLYITVPSTYFRSLGGLCGNYNGDQKDEFTNPKGTVLSTVLDFAKSWKVSDNDLFCHDDCEGKCPNCPAELQEKYSEEKHCGLMSKANGPFATCHKVVNPDIYVDNCVYDVCINKGIRTFLCDNIRSYVDACMAAGVKIDANWRMLSDCPMQCPENSHYEACATACAASCGDRDAPAKCKQPCVEGCQCNPGFVLSGDKCVPLKECGCTYEGRYYPPADTFWGDKACTKKCSCNSQTGQVTCTTTKCTASQVCDLRNGVRDCYPLSYGQCQGSGDPHYRTFDGKTFDFQGTCTYYLSKLVNTADASLVPYEVLVKNENRGMNKAVSFTKTVEIKIYGYTIILSKDSYGKVMVNGLFVNLPFEKEEGRLSVFRSGYFGTVKTDFGMTVIFNWDSHVSITLPSTYSNMVGGLCGNWNGNQNDDMTMPDKTITTNPTAFGTSWKARNDSGCTEECQGKKCPKCDDAERKKDIFTKGCSLITDKNGPFKGCHARVNPTQFYEDCVYDMCMYGGHITALCNSLSAYTAACQTALTVVEKWRSDTFCPAACKANSHYDVCAAGCPQTCNGLAEPTACQGAPCVEGCVCDNGFVLSNGECVAMEQCGCTYEGQYYHLGQIFYPKDQCNHRCICGDQGRVKCNESFSCGPNERCEIRGGVRACHPEGKGSCSVSGSGTYQSYDGNQINVPGNCVYRMVEIIQTGDQKQIPFSVSVQQLSSLGAAVITRKIDIIVAAYKITLIPGLLWEIRVDQVKAVLPLTLEDGLVKVYQSGFFIILETSFGLKVTYDTVAMAIVEIPSTYKKAVRGLCGDYNDKKEDDFFLPNGKQALSAVEFVQGWMLVQEEVTCQTGCGSRCPQPDKDSQTKAENACKILILDKGPFANCHSKVSPTTFYDACVKDAASHPEDKTLVCHHIQTYVAHCQQASVSINIWRNATFCSMTCPTNSHYELCADTCSSTCASLTVSHTCPVCLEGCQCDEGYVFDGGECKPVDNCGCLVDGRYYKSGETSVLGDCVEVCTCKAGQFSCEPMQCKEDQVCRNKDGVPSCVYVPRLSTPPPDPCAAVKCREREQCQKGVCVPTESATCWAVGDPHYKTFDGKRFDFQGTCTYTMSTTTNTELVPFIILAKNNHRGSNKVAYVRTVSVNVYNQTVVASKQRGMVEVNGEITHLPLTLAGGKLQVVQRGWNVFITTDFGLEVKYDWNMMLYITVPSTYFRSLGGLCGNYNGDQKDEFTNPKGTVLSTVLDFAKSWKVSDNDLFCHDDCEGKCPNCPAELQEKYSEEKHCGLMSKANGPFATCHKVVNPDIYVDNCVYDVCINKGIRTFLCDNIRSYVDACMAAGVKIDANWRMLSDCPMQCPENSHYEACATACAASCGDRDAPAKCKQPCVEGCQCNPGFVLSGDKCVPLKECGCTYEGRYYPPADTFWGDKACTKKCSCNSQTGQVTCTTTKCTASQVCDLRNGVRDCYPLSYGQCQGSGDPHYRTFDGKTFDFQGTCTYYLSKLVNTADASLVPYEVLVKNENRGMNKAVSFTKTVEIKIYGYTIILSKDSYGKVMVNGLFVNLPFEKEEGRLSVFRSGYFGTVKTDFGMTVIFNWDSHVSITLPSTYSNMVGGLCGNWNGNQNDDMTMPDKTITTNPTAFGTSWKARNDSGCTEECQGKKCPKCDDAERKKDIFTKGCSLITDKNGPFKGCHARVNPTQFYEDCVYDMCMYGGHITALCNSLSAYTAACQTALTVVEKWRSDTFCPAACKANSHYDVCAAGCPQTCSGLAEPTACQGAPCVEGCVCDNGFVLSNGECVAMEQCGCTYEGQYYHLGQIFYPKDQCNHRCICGDQGRVKCNESFSCGPNERCEIRGGVRACHPEGKGSCSVSGSGTYQSYDGNQINVPGNCVYRMVEIIQTGDQKQIPFSVSVQQLSSLGAAVITRKIDIIVAAYKITLIPGLLWEIRVDQVKAVLPLTLEDGLVKVYQSGFFIILETSFGLKVTYDTVAMAIVEIPSTYKKAVRGLCGDYNDKKEDDFFLPNGKQALSAVEFVQGWMLVQEEVTCQTGCGSRCPQPDKDSQTKAENACKILILDKGPFANCHSKVSPTTFYDACVKDAASHPEDKTLVCHHIQTYVAHCQQASVSINIWRNATFCSMTCPTNSHYELCADTCSSTCASLTVSHTCPMCLEGCQCDEGYVFDGGECKPVDNCGCLIDGRYYKSGETSVLGDCVEVCTCKAGQFSCEPMPCKEDQVCHNKDGVPSCVYDPCMKMNCREEEDCVEKEREAVCVPKSKASCLAIGDPHYETFDGSLFSFQGTCSYVLVKTSGEDKTLTPFSIINKNQLALRAQGSYMKSAIIKLPGHEIVITHGERNKLIIDGKISFLPVNLNSGNITITQSGNKGTLMTDFGLEVTFDWGEFFKVTVPSSYYKNLVGMCGTYNNDRSDDFVTPDGNLVPDIIEWAASWSVPDNDRACWHFPACTEQEKQRYRGPEYCGLLVDKTGPFANCSETVMLAQFPNDCLFYACLTRGSRKTYCKALNSYVNSCMLAKTPVSPQWKQITKCF